MIVKLRQGGPATNRATPPSLFIGRPRHEFGSCRLTRGSSMESSASLASPPQEGWEGQEQGQESPLVNNYRVMLAAKEQELEELRARVEQAEQQLKIQTKVEVIYINSLMDVI